MKLILPILGLLLLPFFTATGLHSKEQRGLAFKNNSMPSTSTLIKGSYRAVIIGNNQYQDADGVWKTLKTAKKDAESVANLLSNDYGFEDVTLLTDASRRDILHALSDLSKRVEPNDNILVYYAGHGFLDENTKRGYWIPVDAKGQDSTTFIRNSTVRDEINIIAEKTKHTLLISDSCFSGTLLRGGNRALVRKDRTAPYYVKVSKKKSVQILAAGGVEYVDDNYRNSGHSPFTYFLLNELKNNVDRLLTMSELSNNVIKAVANNVDQTPESGVLQGAGDELGEFIFVRVDLNENTVEMLATKKSKNLMSASNENVNDRDEIYIPIPRF